VNYREAYGIHASNVQPREPVRGETFVTRKITRGVAAIAHGLQSQLFLGNLDALRDWRHARDYVEGMWLMLHERSRHYVLATDESHSVREFVEAAFAHVGRHIEWRGTGVGEVGMDKGSNQPLVSIDPRYFRPTEVKQLLVNPAKAKRELGCSHRVGVKELVAEMMESDLQRLPRARQRYGPE
jgi:GDPmannose 4,6-dehydratase